MRAVVFLSVLATAYASCNPCPASHPVLQEYVPAGACKKGHESTVLILLDGGAKINLVKDNGTTPVYIACQGGHESTVLLLLDRGAKINLAAKDGATPLFW